MQQQFDELCAAIAVAMEREKLPGLAIGILADGQEFTAGLGVTSIENPLPVDENTFFQIGSTTKTFTATALMRLVERGQLDLDTPIRTYLPDFTMRDREVAEHVTARHLLTHTGGWRGDFFEDTGAGDDALAIYVRKMAELEQLTPLGAVWSYNNAAFSLAGHLLARITGKTYETALDDLVLKPLGLKRSLLFPTHVMTNRFAVGHGIWEGRAHVLRHWDLVRANWPAGGIAASVKDQLRYARFHLGDGTAEDGARVLQKAAIAAMQTPIRGGALDTKMGLSWMINDIGGVRFVQHGGGTNGQLSYFTMAPERKFALAILTNAGTSVMIEAAAMALEKFLGVKNDIPKPIAKPQSELSEYAGRYEAALDAIELRIGDGGLTLQVIPYGGFPVKDSPPGPKPPPTRVAFIAKDRVIALDPPFKDVQAEFLRDRGGAVEWFRHGGRIHRRSPLP